MDGFRCMRHILKNNLLSSSLMSTISLTWSLYATMHLPGWLCSLNRIRLLTFRSQMKIPNLSNSSPLIQYPQFASFICSPICPLAGRAVSGCILIPVTPGGSQLQCDVDQLMNILRGVIQHQLRREIQFPHQLFGLDKFSYGKTHMAVRSHYNRLFIFHASL